MFAVGDTVLIRRGAVTSTEIDATTAGEVVWAGVEGVDYRAYERPSGTPVYIVRFPADVCLPDSINYHDELVLLTHSSNAASGKTYH